MRIAEEFLVLLEAIAHVHKHPDPKGYVADVKAAWAALTEPEPESSASDPAAHAALIAESEPKAPAEPSPAE